MAIQTTSSVETARLSDTISLILLAKVFPAEQINRILGETHKASIRERKLPATLMVYYIMALALYMGTSCQDVLEHVFTALKWFSKPDNRIRTAAKSAISQARARLGEMPMKKLYEQLVGPIATINTREAYYRKWHLVSIDATTMNIADTPENELEFGRPGFSHGDATAFPQMRFCSLVENGTHVLFGANLGPCTVGEMTLVESVIKHLRPGMLALADRGFFSYDLWKAASTTGADLLWRVKKNLILPCIKRLPDGSYLSKIYPSPKARKYDTDGIVVRVIEYKLSGLSIPGKDSIYRLITTILDYNLAPATELAVLYADRWSIETAFDELKTHMCGAKIILRSKTPEGVRQEFWGFLLAHHAVRTIMHDAALQLDIPPQRLSYVHTVRVIQRNLPFFIVCPPNNG